MAADVFVRVYRAVEERVQQAIAEARFSTQDLQTEVIDIATGRERTTAA